MYIIQLDRWLFVYCVLYTFSLSSLLISKKNRSPKSREIVWPFVTGPSRVAVHFLIPEKKIKIKVAKILKSFPLFFFVLFCLLFDLKFSKWIMWAIGNKSRERASHIEKDIFWLSAISPPDRVISPTAGYVSSGRIFI